MPVARRLLLRIPQRQPIQRFAVGTLVRLKEDWTDNPYGFTKGKVCLITGLQVLTETDDEGEPVRIEGYEYSLDFCSWFEERILEAVVPVDLYTHPVVAYYQRMRTKPCKVHLK